MRPLHRTEQGEIEIYGLPDPSLFSMNGTKCGINYVEKRLGLSVTAANFVRRAGAFFIGLPKPERAQEYPGVTVGCSKSPSKNRAAPALYMNDKMDAADTVPVFELQEGSWSAAREILQNRQHFAPPAEVSVVAAHYPFRPVGRLLL